MIAVREHAGRVASAVRGESALALALKLGELDAETGPIPFKGFHEHFVRLERGRIRHTIFCYAQPTAGAQPDPDAQLHLFRLAGHILDLNYFCQRAHHDDALGVALQGTAVPQVLDAIIVRAAFFAALFENMLSVPAAGETTAVDFKAHRATLDRHLLMAGDLMLDPAHLTSLLPTQVWPHTGIELEIAPHEGDAFINGVYLPVAQATAVTEEMRQRSDVAASVSAAA